MYYEDYMTKDYHKFQNYTKEKYPGLYVQPLKKTDMEKDKVARELVGYFNQNIDDLCRDIFTYIMSSYLLNKKE